MELYKVLKSNDSAFPYNIWSENRNAFIAKAYTQEMAELILKILIEFEKNNQLAANKVNEHD